MSADYDDGDECFVVLETGEEDQYFILEGRKPNRQGQVYNRPNPVGYEDCCYPMREVGEGLLVTHIQEDGWYEADQDTTPPLLSVESATGRFLPATGSPDPDDGITRLDYDSQQTAAKGPGAGREGDLFRPMQGGDEYLSNAFTPFTNPNTNLYSDRAWPRYRQDVYSGISLYDIEWVAGADTLTMKLHIEDPDHEPDGADTLRADMSIDGLLQLTGDLVIPAGRTLTLETGSVVVAGAEEDRLNGGDAPTRVEIGCLGVLDASGTAADPVKFLSSRSAEFADQEYRDWAPEADDPAAGDWRSVRFLDDSLDTRASDLTYCEFEYPEFGVQVDSIACTLFKPAFTATKQADVHMDRDTHIQPGTVWDLEGPVEVVIAPDVGYGGGGGGDETDLVEGLVRGTFRTSGSGSDSVLFVSEDEDAVNGDDWFGFVFTGGSVADISRAQIGYAVAPLSFWGADTAIVRGSKIHAYSTDGILAVTDVDIEGCTIVRGETLDPDVTTTGVHIASKATNVSGCLIGGQNEYGIWGDYSQAYCTSSSSPSPPETLRIVDCRLPALLGTPEPGGLSGGTGIYLGWMCHEMRGEVYGDTLNTWRGGLSDVNGVGIVLNRCSDTDVACCVVNDGKTGVFFRRDGTKLPSGEEAVWLRQNEIRSHSEAGLMCKIGVDSLVIAHADTTVAGRNVFQMDSSPGDSIAPFVSLVSVASGDILAAFDQTWEDSTGAVYGTVGDVLPFLDPGSGLIAVTSVLDNEELCEVPSAYRPALSGLAEDRDGESGQLGPGVDLPTSFELHASAPNPSDGGTSIRFSIAAGAPVPVSIDIFDVAGRRVLRSDEGLMPPGRHVRSWDGRDQVGARVAAGVYFLRLTAGEFRSTRKVVVSR